MANLKSRTNLSILTRFLNRSTPPSSFSTTTTRTLETLAYEEIPSSTSKPHAPTAFILHGLLGSGRNWRSFSRTLTSIAELRLVDLRNHGRSAEIDGIEPPHDMFNAAKDLADLVMGKGWEWPDVVVGHSMGGKVALQFAQSCARGDYGDSVSIPKQNSCGYWILSLDK